MKELPDYSCDSHICETDSIGLSDIEPPSQASQNKVVLRGYLMPDKTIVDKEDDRFYKEQRDKKFPPNIYSSKYFHSSRENPQKWLNIGIAFDNHHASIIIHDLTGNETDDTKTRFQWLGHPAEDSKRFDTGNVRRLHLRSTKEAGQLEYYDLYFEDISVPREFKRYYPVLRLRMTDRMIKYHAMSVFPKKQYQCLTNDCATFAHNFLIKTLNWLREEKLLSTSEFKCIKMNLVRRNRVTEEGATGDTEISSREYYVLGASGSIALESSMISTMAVGNIARK